MPRYRERGERRIGLSGDLPFFTLQATDSRNHWLAVQPRLGMPCRVLRMGARLAVHFRGEVTSRSPTIRLLFLGRRPAPLLRMPSGPEIQTLALKVCLERPCYGPWTMAAEETDSVDPQRNRRKDIRGGHVHQRDHAVWGIELCQQVSKDAHSDDVDQSFRCRSERSEATQGSLSDRHQSRLLLVFFVSIHQNSSFCGFPCFGALTEGARRATGVSAPKHYALPRYSTFLPVRPPFSFRIESPCSSMR
jgi:hypothetical protein